MQREQYEWDVRNLLLRHYRRDEVFIGALEDLFGHYRRLLLVLASDRILSLRGDEQALPSLKEYVGLVPLPGRYPRAKRPLKYTRKCVEDIEVLAASSGLNADWCPVEILLGLLDHATGFQDSDGPGRLSRGFAYPSNELTITYTPGAGTHDEVIRSVKNWLRELDRKASPAMFVEINGQNEGPLEGNVVRRDTRPRQEEHMRWLYERIRLHKAWGKIANRNAMSVSTVRSEVTHLAEALGITLPRLKPGRPPNKLRL